MKNILKLFLFSVMVLCLFSYVNLNAQENYSMEGTWKRVSTDESVAGAQVNVIKKGDVYSGKFILVTQQMTQACYDTGEIKWFNIKKGSKGLYNMSDMYKREDCSSGFTDKYIEFVDENTINITAMGIVSNTDENFQVWIRVEQK